MNKSMRVSEALREGAAAHQGGRPADADRHYMAALRLDPHNFDGLHLLGLLRWQQERHDEALELIRRALAVNPGSAEACSNLGIVLEALGRHAEALAMYDRALSINPRYAKAMSHRGDALRALGRIEEALANYDRALALAPNLIEAWINRGVTLRALGRPAEALKCYDRILATHPKFAEAHYNRGNCLHALGQDEEALASYDCALALRPSYAEAWSNRGHTLNRLLRYEEALASCDQALAVEPRLAEALVNRGNALEQLRRLEEALACHDAAIAMRPALAQAFSSRGNVLAALGRHTESLQSYAAALALQPGDADIHHNRGLVLARTGRHGEAIADFERALALDPRHKHAWSFLASSHLTICNWDEVAKLAEQMPALVFAGEAVIQPFTCVSYGSDAAVALACARNFAAHLDPSPRKAVGRVARREAPSRAGYPSSGDPARLLNPTRLRPSVLATLPFGEGSPASGEGKLRIAYLSADFRHHAMGRTLAELFELHDRKQFDVIGISFGPDDGSELRARLIRSFDQFRDVRSESDPTVAGLLRELEIDIAIDLMGYTDRCRPGILARRAAPIQASYLGYPGTMGVPCIDYVIADRFVLPFDEQPFYDEKIVHLPDCYQANDSGRKMSTSIPSRSEAGLPEKGFVFCCFSNSYKVARPVFATWMRLLHAIEGSVLWLFAENELAKVNLSREAGEAGVDPGRLVFMAKLEHGEYLARHALADLFLDTVPYNGHATGSNALWTGLPLVTCKGQTFAGRVGASLLHAVGLPELVANDLEEYEAIAKRLASDPSLLASIRRRLAENRRNCPLFDTERFRRHIEAAYLRMWEIHEAGELPRSFAVTPVS